KPVVAGPQYKALYSTRTDAEQHYYGCVTAMDEQVGRLRAELRRLGAAEDTMLWFSSDNGPENGVPGITGGFRERKRSLYEGGVRVPGLLEWPAKIRKTRVVNMPCCTLDYFPTVMEILGFKMQGQVEPIDGVSLVAMIEGKMTQRPRPIGFESGARKSLTDNRYKLISTDGGETFELYDLIADKFETTDIAASHPDIVNSMKETLAAWEASCDSSLAGDDYT
ncbi:MAG: sulfatase family protein, partial [Planctomycetota bacterium]